MKPGHSAIASRIASVVVLAGAALGRPVMVMAQDRPADVQEDVQVQTRGPVHEAFAETVSFNPEPGNIVPKAPPAPIEESAARPEAGGRQRLLDSRLLGLGR